MVRERDKGDRDKRGGKTKRGQEIKGPGIKGVANCTNPNLEIPMQSIVPARI